MSNENLFAIFPYNFSCNMSTKTILLPPKTVKGMLLLNKEDFKREITVPILKILQPIEQAYRIISHVKDYLLKLPSFKPIKHSPEKSLELIYLNPESVPSFNSLSLNIRSELSQLGITDRNFTFSRLTLTYDNWKANEILQAILPDDDGQQQFSSYSIIGHIVHVNLREHLFPYKHVIGQVLLDKIKPCRTVVNKIDSIDNQFRNFKMEILAGESNFKTTVKESNCKFEFDFSAVYWNPRLSTEHGRILSLLKNRDIVFDVFAGVGPFAIPAAACKGCYVIANDLNPACYTWLEHNKRINAVNTKTLRVFNEDGFKFIREHLKTELIAYVEKIRNNEVNSSENQPSAHVIMNLPSLAHTFLPAFIGLMNNDEVNSLPETLIPVVHVYCFVKNEPASHAIRMIEKSLNIDMLPPNSILETICVRNVAPNKEMIRVSLKLNRSILSGNPITNDVIQCKRPAEDDNIDRKKLC